VAYCASLDVEVAKKSLANVNKGTGELQRLSDIEISCRHLFTTIAQQSFTLFDCYIVFVQDLKLFALSWSIYSSILDVIELSDVCFSSQWFVAPAVVTQSVDS
jgi:hypothetical protein